MATAYILLGSNIGNRMQYLKTACMQIEKNCGPILQKSNIYETVAWGNLNQQNFYNACIAVKTTFTPEDLMHTLLKIEEDMGRIRAEKYGPRTIDLDILLIDGIVVKSNHITIPHPHLTERRFALTPLNDIASTVIYPTTITTIEQLLTNCTDIGKVKKIGSF